MCVPTNIYTTTRRQESLTGEQTPGRAGRLQVSCLRSISDLELIAKATAPEDWLNRLEYLPLD